MNVDYLEPEVILDEGNDGDGDRLLKRMKVAMMQCEPQKPLTRKYQVEYYPLINCLSIRGWLLKIVMK